ncbi:HEXXH motif-containing putative peptide modification protein [Streptomyces sp. NPDC005476]|uniref:aKG-HExxH-type peptide beta-hydroxylase n=1 Tax=Streptomyces sp. NPDC005476 TaxID=3156882 RepID=UPI00345414FA
MLPEVPDEALLDLARTGADPGTLALLLRDQDTRRLLLLRAVLEAVEGAGPEVCSARQKARVREDWALLTEADRATPVAVAGGATALPPARARLMYPLTGAWGWRCLRGLTGPATAQRGRLLRDDLVHLGALAAVAAARAGVSFSVRLTAHDGVLALPSLGALRTAEGGAADVEVTGEAGTLTVRQRQAADVTVHLEDGFGAWSGALAWTPAHALPGLLPGTPPVPLDDLDPYRAIRAPRSGSLGGPTTLDDAGRKQWAQAWSGTAAALRTGGEHRLTEALALLRCLVPLESPPGASGAGRGGCSATRREAFGALMTSVPPDPVTFAATLVHELHHAKLSALGDMMTLHQASDEARYFAPWRPDPRPFDGLLQGAYSHLAIADYYQRRALVEPAHRESAWAQHARCRAQVGAVLPALVGSPDLTRHGRLFVDGMAAAYERMDEHPVPRGHRVRAQAYVGAARTLWTQRHAPVLSRPE